MTALCMDANRGGRQYDGGEEKQGFLYLMPIDLWDRFWTSRFVPRGRHCDIFFGDVWTVASDVDYPGIAGTFTDGTLHTVRSG